jgi:uncharacterized protein YxjI
MRYLIKQKAFSQKDGCTIKDEAGNDCFKLKGKLLSLGKNYSFCDMQDKELCYIEQKLLSFMSKYCLNIDSKPALIIRQKLTYNRYGITGNEGNYHIEGNMPAKDFRILKDGVIAAAVTKNQNMHTDEYTVEISENQNPVLMLSAAIVFDIVGRNYWVWQGESKLDNHKPYIYETDDEMRERFERWEEINEEFNSKNKSYNE